MENLQFAFANFIYAYLLTVVVGHAAWLIVTVMFRHTPAKVIRMTTKEQREIRRAQMWMYRQETKYRRH